MNTKHAELPGLHGIRIRFLALLEDRQTNIAQHALAAWESDNAADQCANLEVAQHVLHQIAGSAGSLGFVELGQAAGACEGSIVDFIQSAQGGNHDQLPEILQALDTFVSQSQALLTQAG
jgi:HPt (histidine-containing phosphotransfer) domain-containing protein